MSRNTREFRTKLKPLEFRVFREAGSRWSKLLATEKLGASSKASGRILAMVSGGADSVAMLRVLLALKGRLGFELEVLHVHHGDGVCDGEQKQDWRDRAAGLVQEFAFEHGITFHKVKSESVLVSEADFRRFRWEAIESVWAHASEIGTPYTCVAFAHHRDDLLETRLIRLLRGTGAQGLRAMRTWGKLRGVLVWRPLLSSGALELRDYLSSCGAHEGRDWVEDRSNRDPKYLRNAIRHQLLPQIEAIRKGGVAALARSLEVIAEETETLSSSIEEAEISEAQAKLSRRELMSLSPERRRARLGQWLKRRGVEGYSQTQIKEVLKRLDTDQRRLRFEVCGRVWLVDEMVEIVALPQQV